MTAFDPNQSRWYYTLGNDSILFIKRLYESSYAFLVPESDGHRLLVTALPGPGQSSLTARESFTGPAVQELLDWCLISLQGTHSDKVPTYYAQDGSPVTTAVGCDILLTHTGLIAASELQESDQ